MKMKNNQIQKTENITKYQNDEISYIKKDLIKSLVLSIIAIGAIVVIYYTIASPNLLSILLRRWTI